MIFWRKQKEIEEAIEDYLCETQKCLTSFGEAFEVYFEQGLSQAFATLVDQTHHYEASSDAKRRDIEYSMYEKALIPESRGDILGMLESVDLVPNKAESVLFQIYLQDMQVPPQYVEQIRQLVGVNIESFQLLCKVVRVLFAEPEQVLPTVQEIYVKETASDEIERKLIKSIFDAPGDKAEKILLKELILEIGAISDRAENAGDRLRIVAIKQRT